MTEIDQLFASALEKIIRENLGETTFHSIQNRLFEKHGISITQSIKEFEKLDSVLTEFFGSGAKGLEKKFLEKICKIKSKKDLEEKRLTILDLVMMKCQKFSMHLLESLGLFQKF
jgi:hypothetical protein